MKSITYALLAGVSLAAIGGSAFAQSAAPAPAAEEVEQVIVTGSRIVRDGFQAPTPVTTVTADALMARAPSNIPDALNQLPQFRGSPRTRVR
jgi:iron complex outermembrane receptor protein